jgi:hypothetical protein
MSSQQKVTQQTDSLFHSVKSFNLDGNRNTAFKWTEIPLKKIKDVLTSSNYSTINRDVYRDEEHFIHANAIMVDLDHNATIGMQCLLRLTFCSIG